MKWSPDLALAGRLHTVAVLLAAGLPALGGVVAGGNGLGLLFLLLGGGWWLNRRQNWTGESVLLAAHVALSAWASQGGLPSGWLLAGVTAALGAWDLDRFLHTLTTAGRITGEGQLVAIHLRRLGLVGGLGLALGGGALLVQFQLGFGLALALVVVILLGVSRITRHLSRP